MFFRLKINLLSFLINRCGRCLIGLTVNHQSFWRRFERIDCFKSNHDGETKTKNLIYAPGFVMTFYKMCPPRFHTGSLPFQVSLVRPNVLTASFIAETPQHVKDAKQRKTNKSSSPKRKQAFFDSGKTPA